MIRKELLDILACPKCKGPVELTAGNDGLTCRACRLVYEIRDDIPVAKGGSGDGQDRQGQEEPPGAAQASFQVCSRALPVTGIVERQARDLDPDRGSPLFFPARSGKTPRWSCRFRRGVLLPRATTFGR